MTLDMAGDKAVRRWGDVEPDGGQQGFYTSAIPYITNRAGIAWVADSFRHAYVANGLLSFAPGAAASTRVAPPASRPRSTRVAAQSTIRPLPNANLNVTAPLV